MKHAQYYRNIANGITRIAQAVKLCDLAPTTQGTIFSGRFKYESPPFNFSYGDEFSIEFITKDDIINHEAKTAHECVYKYEDVCDKLKELQPDFDDIFIIKVNLN